MIHDMDLHRATKLLMDRDGKGTAFVAARREATLPANGDLDGVAVWRAGRWAIEGVRRGPREREKLNWQGLPWRPPGVLSERS
jgi:hypothetical protein